MKTEYNKGNLTLRIVKDNSPESPREWDNLGTMVCLHRRYTLGDLQDENLMEIENRKNIISLPIHMYDHSGATINTTGFSCGWDSGKLGFIYVEKEKIREIYSWKLITKKRLEKIEQYLKQEVETYDQFIKGEVYGFELYENDELKDSCYGFYGDNFKENGLFDHAGWTE